MIVSPSQPVRHLVAVGVGTCVVALIGCSAPSSPPAETSPPSDPGIVVLEELPQDRLRLGVDSLVSRFGNMPEGFRRMELKEVDGGYEFTELVAVTEDIWRSVTASFDSSFRVQRVVSSGSQFGQPMGGTVRYEVGRATGDVGGAQGAQVPVDTALPDAAFDGDVLLAVLPALEWTVGETYRLRLFEPASGTASTQTLTVVGEETLRVPAGEFAALRGELTSTQLPVTIWVSREVPRRLLKIGSANGETVLAR